PYRHSGLDRGRAGSAGTGAHRRQSGLDPPGFIGHGEKYREITAGRPSRTACSYGIIPAPKNDDRRAGLPPGPATLSRVLRLPAARDTRPKFEERGQWLNARLD